jgi:hypothetical protein
LSLTTLQPPKKKKKEKKRKNISWFHQPVTSKTALIFSNHEKIKDRIKTKEIREQKKKKKDYQKEIKMEVGFFCVSEKQG